MKKTFALSALAAASALSASAKVELATPFKDKMVLQRRMEMQS